MQWEIILAAVVAVAAGVSFVIQQAVNANLSSQIGSASWAGFISYVGGSLAMLVLILVTRSPALNLSSVAQTSWWSWTGGIFGAIYIAISILLLPRLGAATLVALIVVGQMLTSVIFDHVGVLGLEQHSASLPRVAGALLLIAGVVLIRL